MTRTGRGKRELHSRGEDQAGSVQLVPEDGHGDQEDQGVGEGEWVTLNSRDQAESVSLDTWYKRNSHRPDAWYKRNKRLVTVSAARRSRPGPNFRLWRRIEVYCVSCTNRNTPF